MTDTNASPSSDPEAAIARWQRTLAMLADNDNAPGRMRAGTMVAVLGLPLASTAAVAACLRFLL